MNKEITKAMGFGKEVKLVESGKCPLCGRVPVGFRTARSKREYEISGLCQDCQDENFVLSPAAIAVSLCSR